MQEKDNVFDYDEDELEPRTEKSVGLRELSRQIKGAKKVQEEIESHKARLADAEMALRKILRENIPELIHSMGLSGTITTDTGLKVTVKRKVKASITDKNREQAIAWFQEHNLDRLLTEEVSMKFKRGQAELAKDVQHALEEKHVPYKSKKTVHHSTLSAFCKDRIENDEELPRDILGVFEYYEAKID